LFYEFLDEFKDIRVDKPIRIRESCYPPLSDTLITGILPVSTEFIKYLNRYKNKFVVKTIQESANDDVIICVYEVEGILGYDQVLPYLINKRIFNWRRP
jgi:hypothetical protein